MARSVPAKAGSSSVLLGMRRFERSRQRLSTGELPLFLGPRKARYMLERESWMNFLQMYASVGSRAAAEDRGGRTALALRLPGNDSAGRVETVWNDSQRASWAGPHSHMSWTRHALGYRRPEKYMFRSIMPRGGAAKMGFRKSVEPASSHMRS
ncbi:hypothetical protein HYQ46_009614 [Verticillium longisporum]|nr:hypothetical protein HYQ46_009614 [Verticillium longisporum]